MPAFYLIVILVCIAIWFLAAFLYRPLGGYFKRIFKDSVDAMTQDDENEYTETKGEH